MSSRLPFIQFYAANWIADTRALSLAAKGAWIDILCTLHSSQSRGTMTMPREGWARLIGSPVDQADEAITELSNMRVCDRVIASNGDVTLSSRRMLRESITREQTKQRVAKHRLSNSELLPEESCNEPCNANSNASSNGVVTDRRQKTEDRNHNTDSKAPSRKSAQGSVIDDQWIRELSADPAFYGINVPMELAKMQRWCKENRKPASRRRFINWLNRADRLFGSSLEAPVQRPLPGKPESKYGESA